MTLKFRSPAFYAFAVSLVLLISAPSADAAAAKSPKKPAPKKAAAKKTASKSSSKSAKAAPKSAAKSKRGTTAASRAKDRRSAKQERASSRRGARNDRKASAKETRASRKPTKRERIEAARREAERRRREAERARQIAIARARALAAEQALKEESVANILKDDTTGEDPEVRRVAVEALGNRAGTVVVMNPKTGQVYTVVNQEWGLRRGFKPCSTIKIVSGVAGLSEGVIDPVQTVNIGTSSFSLDLTDSLALSNNGYFQRVGGQVGFEKMMEYARKLGLGQQTGINHKFESPGRLPVFKEGYAVNHMSSHGDDIEVTAIQLANMASTLANGGKLLVPHLPRTPEENVNFKRVVKRDVDIPQEHMQRLLPGMIGAVNYGTARRAYDPTQTIAGKTGTCTGQGTKLGLFTSYGPVHDPKLAVAVITRGAGTGGKYASAVAGDIYRRLNHRFGITPGSAPALANELLAPRPHLDPRKAAEASDEEKEDEADTTDAYVVSESGQSSTTKAGATQPALQKTSKPVERPATSAPSAKPTPTKSAPAERPRRVGDRP